MNAKVKTRRFFARIVQLLRRWNQKFWQGHAFALCVFPPLVGVSAALYNFMSYEDIPASIFMGLGASILSAVVIRLVPYAIPLALILLVAFPVRSFLVMSLLKGPSARTCATCTLSWSQDKLDEDPDEFQWTTHTTPRLIGCKSPLCETKRTCEACEKTWEAIKLHETGGNFVFNQSGFLILCPNDS